MPNPLLTADQLEVANGLLQKVRDMLNEECGSDPEYLWALRRKIAKELVYDERGKPGHRRKLKNIKRKEQGGLCPECNQALPATYCVLDRLEAIGGYTLENTQLLCQACDAQIQASRGFK